jgi:hypothetical protein
MGYAKQPGPEITPLTEQLQPREGFEERFLGQILGHVPIVRQVDKPSIKPIPIALDQDGKRIAVAFAGSVHERRLLVDEKTGVGLLRPACPSFSACRSVRFARHGVSWVIGLGWMGSEVLMID